MRVVIAIVRPFIWALCRLLFRIRFQGVENVPPEGACIITPNHVTYADPVWITIPLRRRIYYMAWDKPFKIPGLGLLMRAFGAFPLNLESVDMSAQRDARYCVRKGRALVIFPEGGRTVSGRLESFKMGAFRLALTEGIQIVPVSIDGAETIWPRGRVFPRPGKLRITYHPPIFIDRAPQGLSKAELKQQSRAVARKTRDIVASGLGSATMHGEEEASLL